MRVRRVDESGVRAEEGVAYEGVLDVRGCTTSLLLRATDEGSVGANEDIYGNPEVPKVAVK